MLENLSPDHTFDGGDLDCGSGLALLIRQHMLQLPPDGVLEVRSSDPTVASDLPPWCKMTGHTYLGSLPGEERTRYFVRRGPASADDARQLQADQERARGYEWRVRTRVTGHLKNTVYCRNFAFDVGQPASFEERDQFPSAVEYLLGALSASLSAGFAGETSRAGLAVDDIEITARGQLENVLALLGDDGDNRAGEPAFSKIEVKCFASSLDDEAALQAAWERAVRRSPVAATLRKAVEMQIKFAVV
jgi:TusA-related sulfurtransferase